MTLISSLCQTSILYCPPSKLIYSVSLCFLSIFALSCLVLGSSVFVQHNQSQRLRALVKLRIPRLCGFLSTMLNKVRINNTLKIRAAYNTLYLLVVCAAVSMLRNKQTSDPQSVCTNRSYKHCSSYFSYFELFTRKTKPHRVYKYQSMLQSATFKYIKPNGWVSEFLVY